MLAAASGTEGEILVGTASWTDKTLLDSGRFYPGEAKSPEATTPHISHRLHALTPVRDKRPEKIAFASNQPDRTGDWDQ
jgi:hypothetical protein